jgi:hypothetical protein
VVFLNPGSQVLGNLQAPSDVDLDAVLVDARSGAVIEGFLSFDSSSRGLQVGSE